jgi:hypothetical protein
MATMVMAKRADDENVIRGPWPKLNSKEQFRRRQIELDEAWCEWAQKVREEYEASREDASKKA